MTNHVTTNQQRGSECLEVAMEYDLCKNIGYINVCTEFDIFKVKVYIIFLGTMDFSARREGRYSANLQSGLFGRH